jgi:hypothetical protein
MLELISLQISGRYQDESRRWVGHIRFASAYCVPTVSSFLSFFSFFSLFSLFVILLSHASLVHSLTPTLAGIHIYNRVRPSFRYTMSV